MVHGGRGVEIEHHLVPQGSFLTEDDVQQMALGFAMISCQIPEMKQ